MCVCACSCLCEGRSERERKRVRDCEKRTEASLREKTNFNLFGNKVLTSTFYLRHSGQFEQTFQTLVVFEFLAC